VRLKAQLQIHCLAVLHLQSLDSLLKRLYLLLVILDRLLRYLVGCSKSRDLDLQGMAAEIVKREIKLQIRTFSF